MPARTPAQMTAARARRAAQRRTASALRQGRPTLPQGVTRPVRAATRRAILRHPEALERHIGDKDLGDTDFGAALFRDLWQYSPDTVRFMAEHMSEDQKEQALTISTEEYRQLAAEQSQFNVFWYHHMDNFPEVA
jgi:hypothetical protein